MKHIVKLIRRTSYQPTILMEIINIKGFQGRHIRPDEDKEEDRHTETYNVEIKEIVKE